MVRDPTCCTPGDGIIECARVMKQEEVSLVPVVESRDTRRLIGACVDRDVCLTVVAGGLNPADVTVEECMTDEVFSVNEDDELERARDLMRRIGVWQLPVVDENHSCVGVIDVMRLDRAMAATLLT